MTAAVLKMNGLLGEFGFRLVYQGILGVLGGTDKVT